MMHQLVPVAFCAFACCLPEAFAEPVEIFTADEVAQCGDIRIPQMTVTPSGILLAAQCRNANSSLENGFVGVGDNMVKSKVVTKFSKDHGITWGPMQVLTPISHSHGQVVYD